MVDLSVKSRIADMTTLAEECANVHALSSGGPWVRRRQLLREKTADILNTEDVFLQARAGTSPKASCAFRPTFRPAIGWPGAWSALRMLRAVNDTWRHPDDHPHRLTVDALGVMLATSSSAHGRAHREVTVLELCCRRSCRGRRRLPELHVENLGAGGQAQVF
jgi:hypothetical protein